MLAAAEKKTLLTLAHRVLHQVVLFEKAFQDSFLEGLDLSPVLKERRGAFVTLRKRGALRGCIGYIEPVKPLYVAVAQNTYNAAVRDERFDPVQSSELENLTIDISVIGPLKRVDSPREIVLGFHGVVLEKEECKSIFLPQVAVEQNWDLEELLSQLSLKAGLSRNDWESGAAFSVFTTESFSESDL